MEGHNHHNMAHGAQMDMGKKMGNHSMMMGMKSYFHADLGDYMLFETLQITTIAAMVGACVVTFILAVLYEGLKVLREHLLRKAIEKKSFPTDASNNVVNSASGESMPFSERCGNELIPPAPSSKLKLQVGRLHFLSAAHFIQTTLHMLQLLLSYVLMLLFMTYSVWLCLAVILGAGVGYFAFGWRRAILSNTSMDSYTEHCH